MNSLEFDALQLRLVEYLRKRGPTISERLAAELAVPHGQVRFALEQLRQRKEPLVTSLPFGFWDSTDQNSIAA